MENKRQSNLELYRIVCMLFIIGHHYVVNSGIANTLFWDTESMSPINRIYLFSLGAWGKTAINSFVLITGYFMCNSTIFKKVVWSFM